MANFKSLFLQTLKRVFIPDFYLMHSHCCDYLNAKFPEVLSRVGVLPQPTIDLLLCNSPQLLHLRN